MSNDRTKEPKIDHGYYAAIPRLVRTHYKNLTANQKWLYTCLKDLCGDKGTCYRTLRVLSEETDISTGMLSESIPVLHDAGLIHAEKKKRKEGGKEVWHITIVDIWQANGKEHPMKRSSDEQVCSLGEHTFENVHWVNENSEVRSLGEQECSQNRDRRNNILRTNNIEEITDIREAGASLPQQASSPPKKKSSSKKTKNHLSLLTASEIPAPQKPDPSAEPYNALLFMKLADYYRGNPLKESTRSNSDYQRAVDAATVLVQKKKSFEEVDMVFAYLYGRGAEIGKPWLEDKKWREGGYSVDLWVVAKHIDAKLEEIAKLNKKPESKLQETPSERASVLVPKRQSLINFMNLFINAGSVPESYLKKFNAAQGEGIDLPLDKLERVRSLPIQAVRSAL